MLVGRLERLGNTNNKPAMKMARSYAAKHTSIELYVNLLSFVGPPGVPSVRLHHLAM